MKTIALFILAITLLTTGCMNPSEFANINKQLENLNADPELETAVFAGGCFWCTESAFQELEGVEEAVSGYAGGEEENPTYQQVVGHQTGHREALKVYYYPEEISYQELLDAFWNSIDPTDEGGQYADRGFNYTTAIFYNSEEEQKLAEESLAALEESEKYDKPIATKIEPYTTFYPAEDFHQDFYKHSAERYKIYKNASGRK